MVVCLEDGSNSGVEGRGHRSVSETKRLNLLPVRQGRAVFVPQSRWTKRSAWSFIEFREAGSSETGRAQNHSVFRHWLTISGDTVFLINSVLFFNLVQIRFPSLQSRSLLHHLTESNCAEFWYRGEERIFNLNIHLLDWYLFRSDMNNDLLSNLLYFLSK